MTGKKGVGCLAAYLKGNLKWFLAIMLCGGMMAVTMFLNGIAWSETLYGIGLCLFFLLVIVCADFWRYRRRYKKLLEVEQSVTLSLDGLPESAGGIEEEYQRLLELLAEENARLGNEAIRRERDMTEYYTMWVHQIKTPIAALKLLLESGSFAEEMDEESSGAAQFAADRGEELQELFRIEQYVEMALSYMRIGSESTDFVLRKVDLDVVIREVVHKYARQFIRKKIKLNYEAVETVVLTDEKWLEFVIGQLLSNALKYTPSGSISIYMENENLVIADTGIGIRQEDLPRVCEKGYTGYNGHANKRSTGIGLYLCSSILKKLGHGFTITSEEGRGTQAAIEFLRPNLEVE